MGQPPLAPLCPPLVRADVLFRRAESKYSVEQVSVIVEFYDVKLNGVSYNDPVQLFFLFLKMHVLI